VPTPKELSTTYFLRLTAIDSTGKTLSTNFYWLSTREDVLDWKKTEWYFTPTKVHADLTALAKLPATSLAVSARFGDGGPDGTTRVSVENTGKTLAFQVHLKLVDPADGREILPVFWEDNYFQLFPGEKRDVTVSCARAASPLAVEADAWNAPRVVK
jgi:exo-1,4-beta-D-glucosaminidase